MSFEASKSRLIYRNCTIRKFSQRVVGKSIVFEHSKIDRGVESKDSMSFFSENDEKSDEFRVLEHKSTGREKKFEGIESSEDSMLDISRGADLDRTSKL